MLRGIIGEVVVVAGESMLVAAAYSGIRLTAAANSDLVGLMLRSKGLSVRYIRCSVEVACRMGLAARWRQQYHSVLQCAES